MPRDADGDLGGVDDMTKLTYLNEPGVLYNLSRRYALNEIYVSTSFRIYAVTSNLFECSLDIYLIYIFPDSSK